MPTRALKRKTHHGEAQNNSSCSKSSSLRIDTEVSSLTQEQLNETSQETESKFTQKRTMGSRHAKKPFRMPKNAFQTTH